MFVKQDCNIEELINKILTNNENELLFDWRIYTEESFNKLSQILIALSNVDKPLKIIIGFNKVEEVKLSNISSFCNKNFDFHFSLDGFTYTYDEFNKVNERLDSLIKEIDDSMSPFEKYTYIYNLVRKYKQYKVIDQSEVFDLKQLLENKNQSCNLKYILDSEYMDCKGFSFLLQTLLNKVGIESTDFGVYVNMPDGSKAGHARTIINLDDDKYNIHGIFISDPTWDSQSKDDSLEYSLLPIESMRDSIYQQCDETLLFDANNQFEFLQNIQTLKKNTSRYENFTRKIIAMINAVDRKESSKLMNLTPEELFLELQQYILSKNSKESIINRK